MILYVQGLILYVQGLIFESKNSIIRINLKQSNDCFLYSLKSKDLVCINNLLSLFFYDFYDIILVYTHKS